MVGVLPSLSSWAPVPLDQLWVSYTSVLFGLELEAGMALLGIRAMALPQAWGLALPQPGLCLPYHIFSRSVWYFSSRTLFSTD